MSLVAARLKVEVGADTRPAEAGLKSFSGRLNNAAKSMTSIGTKMTLGLTTPLVGIAVSAVNLAADFEQSMNILQQVTGASNNAMAAMQQQALALGADTVFSAGEAAEGMLELAKAGMDTEQVMAAIPGVMSLAAAAGTSLGQAAGITAAALNAFGLEASESARVADMLAAGANASSADITDLAAGLQQAGFAFDMANQPIESLVASLALLTNVGLTGSDAGTALKNAFMRMMNPTNEALELMKELNISFYDAEGNMKMLPAIIDNLNASLANLTPQQRDAALATIFLSDGMKAMVPLLDAGSAGFNAMVGEVTQVGAASETANARMGGLSGGIEQLKGAVESFMIGAALPFLDTLGGLARGAADAITSFGALPAPILNTSLAIAGILAAAGPVILILGTLAGAISAIGAPVAIAVAAIAALGAAWAADVGGIQSITASTFSAVQGWFNTTRASAQQLASGIQTAFSNTSFPSLDELMNQFRTGGLPALMAEIKTTAVELMINLDTELNITGRAEQLRAQLESVLSGLGAAITLFGSQITGSFTVDLSGAGQRWSQAMTNLTNTINTQDWSALGQNIGEAIRQFLTFDAAQAESFANNFAASVRGAIASADWGDINTAFSGLAVAVRGAIFEVMGGIGKELAPLAATMNQSFSTSMEQTGADIRASIAGAWTSLGTAISDGFNTMIAGVVSSFMGSFGPERISAMTNGLNMGSAEGPPAFEWSQFISPISWGDFVTAIGWGDWITRFTWSDWITGMTWDDWITGITWSDWITGITWSDWITGITWSSFIPDVNWETIIPDFSWSSWLRPLSWGDFIPFLGGGGGATPVPAAPSSGGGGGGFGGGGGIARGGGTRSLVGVNGITVNVANVNSPMDVHSAVNTLVREIRRRVR